MAVKTIWKITCDIRGREVMFYNARGVSDDACDLLAASHLQQHMHTFTHNRFPVSLKDLDLYSMSRKVILEYLFSGTCFSWLKLTK